MSAEAGVQPVEGPSPGGAGPAGRYEQIESSEPVLLVGAFTGVAGLLGLLAANFSLAHGAGLAVGMTASQALLSRPATVSPKSVGELLDAKGAGGTLAKVIGAASATPRPDEPVATVGAFVFLAGFLVQLFSGVDMVTAFASAAALAGVQTTATRARVFSPASGRRIVAKSIVRNLPEPIGSPELKRVRSRSFDL